MEVIEFKEQEDGSAIIELDITEDEKQMLLNLGFETMIRWGMNESENPAGLELPPTGLEKQN